jgi:hypothetical protein
MSIRKIRANTANVDGDFIIVESDSWKPFGIIIGFLIGLMLCLVFEVSTDDIIVVLLITSFFGVLIGLLVLPGRVVRQIPSIDLVEIKRYKNTNRVTVVLDDARTKRRQPEVVSE